MTQRSRVSDGSCVTSALQHAASSAWCCAWSARLPSSGNEPGHADLLVAASRTGGSAGRSPPAGRPRRRSCRAGRPRARPGPRAGSRRRSGRRGCCAGHSHHRVVAAKEDRCRLGRLPFRDPGPGAANGRAWHRHRAALAFGRHGPPRPCGTKPPRQQVQPPFAPVRRARTRHGAGSQTDAALPHALPKLRDQALVLHHRARVGRVLVLERAPSVPPGSLPSFGRVPFASLGPSEPPSRERKIGNVPVHSTRAGALV